TGCPDTRDRRCAIRSALTRKAPFVTKASHIFRSRPDGSGIEPVMTGGMDNPVDVVFTPGGERIFTTTFLVHPGGGLRDGLIHAVYGGIYGKDQAVVHDGNHKWTSPSLMPVLTHLGAAAPCGLTRYESRIFGPEYQDNLFACLFNMHKITRHVLEPTGATFKCRDEDFLVSDNIDFHPTDVLEDADGSLLVVDTGGWYKLCCPTSQLHKPDVLGGIYRIRRSGSPHIGDPRGLELPWSKLSAEELASLLDDERPALRRRAIQTMAERGRDALPVLVETVQSGKAAEARRNAVWTATRIDHAEARAIARAALADADETVRQAAIHSISVRRDHDALLSLIGLLKTASLHNRRAAAEAIGRIGDKTAVPALLATVGEPADRALEHSLTYALVEIGDRDTVAAGLKSANVLARRAALTALDQMNGGNVDVEAVKADLTSTDVRMKETAWWIAGRHPEWGGALAGFFRDRLAEQGLSAAERDELVSRLARFASATPIQELLTERLHDAAASRDTRIAVLRAIAQASLKEAPVKWVAGVAAILGGNDAELLREAVATARSLRVSKSKTEQLSAALLKIARSDKAPAALRVNALAAVPVGLTNVEKEIFAFLRVQLDPEQPVAVRSIAADVLSRSKLSVEQLGTLTETLKAVGPVELDRLLEPFTQTTDENVGLKLVAALQASSARAALRAETVKPRLAKYNAKVQKQAEALYAALDADAAEQKVRLEKLLASMKGGDIRRGQAVFNGSKASCSACHAIGYLGGNVGPDLTRIGGIRTERDLLESIVFPSASLVRSYESVLVTTKDGKTVNGLIRKDAPDEILLATGLNQEVRIARKDIEDIQPSKISIMPAGLDQQLTVQELADLVAFLKACK
ncbi:MAG TPA: HEAT repeat domain-containing protein, partial [Gemmataceae bacterium]|nr:HEAT repeat domain-containing protein [Gemmataceae bacterium]